MNKPSVPELSAQLKSWMTEVMSDPEHLRSGEPVAPMQHLWERFTTNEDPKLRLSFGSKCARRQWYSHHRPNKADSPGMARFTFSMGDLWEVLGFRALEEAIEDHPHLDVPRDSAQGEVEIEVDGHAIVGHLDGFLTWDGEPFVAFDFKQTGKWPFSKWDHKRLPPEVWGYRHQAANYMAALRKQGHKIEGFLWLVHLKDVNGFEVGWATWDELRPYHLDAVNTYAVAMGDTPPARCAGFPDAVPCAGKARKYCPFFNHCSEDRT